MTQIYIQVSTRHMAHPSILTPEGASRVTDYIKYALIYSCQIRWWIQMFMSQFWLRRRRWPFCWLCTRKLYLFSELGEIKRIALRTHNDFGIDIFDGPGVCRVNIKLTYPLLNVSLKYTIPAKDCHRLKIGVKTPSCHPIHEERTSTSIKPQTAGMETFTQRRLFKRFVIFWTPFQRTTHNSNHIIRRWNLEGMMIYTVFYDIFWPGFTPGTTI